MLLFISVLTAVLLVYLIQYKIYDKHALDKIKYDIRLSAREVFEGEDIFVTEEITNEKGLPIPFAKIDVTLPDGLKFRISKKDKNGAALANSDVLLPSVQSVFVLKPYCRITRQWRVFCEKRGEYRLGDMLLVTNDILGLNAKSKLLARDQSAHSILTVLPKAIELNKEFTLGNYDSGTVNVPQGLIRDPLIRAGIREYTPLDPMRMINWNASARHRELMVNIEDYTKRHRFNIIMNMQSVMGDKIPGEPMRKNAVEMCITVAASILDSVAVDNINVRVFSNFPPAQLCEEDSAAVGPDDEIGKNVYASPIFSGKKDIINVLSLFSRIVPFISVPVEKLLDHIVMYPENYISDGNIIFITPFIDERMINFYRIINRRGVGCIFFVTSASGNASIIPGDIPVFYKTAKQ